MATTSPQELLENVYDQLGYTKGALYNGDDEPEQFSKEDWIEKGEWLTLTKKVGAEKIFFVENNPVAIFAKSDVNEPETLRQLFNKIWCMSRPRLLFLAVPGELAIYDLAREPARDPKEWKNVSPLDFARSANEVAKKLRTFRREQIETGRLFEDKEYRFGDIKNRADKALINDLKGVRRELIDKGLGGENIKYAHALIGRSIFIRYLEDRGIVIPEDFYEIASNNKEWKEILKNNVPRPGINLSEEDPLYARVLSDRDFTFALFEKLAKDFNGDMFPDVQKEKQVITQEHLHLIQDLLFGDVGKQKKLFFYAYKFEIVPIELISSIYEEFYHPQVKKEKNRKPKRKSSEGAYYTPPVLVEFLVNQVLTPERLSTKPRILDPSCGSGIFLVEAFRRIVRHRILELGRKPNFQNLQKILREQIAGIEINPEAARIAAFSLYLAMLHYLDPPSVREQIYIRGNRLPNLIFDEFNQQGKSYNTILPANAFGSEYIDNNPVLRKTFSANCADTIIGNPPWGSPRKKGKDDEEDRESREANKVAIEWCEQRQLPIGDQERSQAFIWRTLDLLKPNGQAGLLVSTGIFFKHHHKSVEFRKKWLSQSTLSRVFNFSHTRKVFFSGADSPFATIIFSKENHKKSSTSYWSSKRTSIVENLISVVFSKSDIRILPYDIEELQNYQTWKILWWGSHRDKQLVNHLSALPHMVEFSKEGLFGRGYDKSGQQYESDWLKKYKTLPINYFTRYGKLEDKYFILPPNRVNRRGLEEIYSGLRLLVKRGIEEKGGVNGRIIARLEENDFCFTNSIHGVKLIHNEEWKYKIILGIIWSSLIRYYLFLTTSNWGNWHHEIHLEDELMQLPVRFPTSVSLKNRIVNIVDKLRSSTPDEIPDMFQSDTSLNNLSGKEIAKLERQLDDAIFKLYELNDAEIDLVRSMCDVTLPYYYSPHKSPAGKPILTKQMSKPYGTIESLPKDMDFSEYLQVFIESWIPYLYEGTEFGWQVHQPEQTDSMIAVVLSVEEENKQYSEYPNGDIKCWDDVLIELEDNLTQPFRSSRIFIEGMVRAVTDNFIMVIKRNERRLWTKSMAREDAEATLVQAMNRKNMRERLIQKQ